MLSNSTRTTITIVPFSMFFFLFFFRKCLFQILLFYYYRQKLDDFLRNFIRNKPNLLVNIFWRLVHFFQNMERREERCNIWEERRLTAKYFLYFSDFFKFQRKFINYLDEFSGCATDKKRYEMLMKEMEKYGVSDTSKHTFGSSRAIGK